MGLGREYVDDHRFEMDRDMSDLIKTAEKKEIWLTNNFKRIPFNKIDKRYATNIINFCKRNDWYCPQQIKNIAEETNE